ncbi:MAG: fibrobacter succinogenes major paralogous domain-containing protein [Bacteroidetes bacterium]|nr:fibrobacter succinogenes major paralogous domain-containing protein [Bacteroidota bacterium]
MTRFFLLSTLVCFAGALSAQTSCPNPYDGNGDGAVTINDLLDLLGLFGDADTDQDGIWDSVDACVDTGACNYAADPTESCAYIDVLGICGGGCEGDGDGDGVCDDVDTCVGDLDECGVCNGPGPTEIVIESITILYDSVYAPQIDTWFVFEVGADTTFSYTCAPFFGACGDPVSYQGYDYATVLIGDQCWFAENLRNEYYENGDGIPANLSDGEWSSTTSGALAVYGEDLGCETYSPDIDACEPAPSLNEYGRLYNWYAVDDSRGLCPSGWHVPTDGEWITMEMALGMSEAEANGTGWRGTDQGAQMKTDYGWYNGGNGTNSSGFSGLPGGYRYDSGLFNGAGYLGFWWSSSPYGFLAWDHYLGSSSEYVNRNINDRRVGFSVRCVRDAE